MLGDYYAQEAEYKRKLKAKRKQRDGLEADLVGGGARGGGRSSRGGARRGRTESGIQRSQCVCLQNCLTPCWKTLVDAYASCTAFAMPPCLHRDLGATSLFDDIYGFRPVVTVQQTCSMSGWL